MTFLEHLLKLKVLPLLALCLTITQMIVRQPTVTFGAGISSDSVFNRSAYQTDEDKENFLRIFRAIAGNNSTSFTRARFKEFLKDNPFRDPAFNKQTFLYASDFAFMKKNFQSGIFGDVIEHPVGVADEYRSVTFWGLNFANRYIPIVATEDASEIDIAAYNAGMIFIGGDHRLGRKIRVAALADVLFDIMVENNEDKTKVSELDFVRACYRITRKPNSP